MVVFSCISASYIIIWSIERVFMVVLQNDAGTARERANSLANGVSSLNSSGVVSKDGQTKLGGNDKAKEVIDRAQELSTQLGNTMMTMSQNIQSVSSSFQAMDRQIGNQIKSTGFSLNEPK